MTSKKLFWNCDLYLTSCLQLISFQALVTFLAIQVEADHRPTSDNGLRPVANRPWRIMTHVLKMSTTQFRDPVIVQVFVVAGNRLLHV